MAHERTRRARWRTAVYKAPHMTNATRLLLIRLADDMHPDGFVSIPRSTLADSLGVHPSRITERIHAAEKAGWLSTRTPGRPGATAEYAATFPTDWNGS